MNKIIIPVLASVLILGLIGFSQEASAIDYVVSNEAECLAFPGSTTFGFQNLETCFLTSDFTFNVGDTLTVENIEFQASSTITNFGTIELIGGDSFGKGRINLRGGGHLINECGGIVNANGGTGTQSGELALASTSIITNFDTINLFGGDGILSGTILSGQPGATINNHGTINENPGAGSFSGVVIGFSSNEFNDNLPNPCDPTVENLINQINLLENVADSVKTSLTGPLNQAIDLINDGIPQNDAAVCGKLNAFLNEVDAKEGNGDLTSELANDLRDATQSVIEELGC